MIDRFVIAAFAVATAVGITLSIALLKMLEIAFLVIMVAAQ